MGGLRKLEARSWKLEDNKNRILPRRIFQLPASSFLLFIVATLLSCTKDKLSVEESRATVKLLAGKVQMFGRNDFELNIPELEVNIYEVTNASFADFVKKTGYMTTAEQSGEGMVFDLVKKEWVLTRGADWKHPQGPQSSDSEESMHPVVQVSYDDACAYCDWLEMRLPYESEWEYIYQLDQNNSKEKFNKWDGIFPIEDKGEDGFTNTAPVGSFKAGRNGIYDLQGNVWEWCIDLYHKNWPQIDTTVMTPLLQGPTVMSNLWIMNDTLRVIKGGSFLCAENYCMGYQNEKRQNADPKLSYEHVGFRCVRDLKKKE